MYYPLFDLASVQIPIGFKPSSSIFDVEDPFQQLLDRIASHTGMQAEGVISEMNELIQNRFDGKIRSEAALVIIAKQHNVTVQDLVPALTVGIQKNRVN